ncbi:MAG: amidohydrolase [Liquorilactobacillus nagelii]|uniref:amidohydrolase n=1 Tax=Liquorilactobacillus nagelii TaxID=82688 RepID=UPI0039E863A2
MDDETVVVYDDKAILEKTIGVFEELHRHPELSNKERWTTKFIKGKLNDLGIKIVDMGLETGVVGEICSKRNTNLMIALRADIDALPVLEKTDLTYKSLNVGCSHACGHDFHTAALLAAAKIISENREKLTGNVRLIFEPGEENHSGASQMIAAGALKGVAAIFGMHNLPTIPNGVLAVKSGIVMASNDNFQVKIKGISAHAAMPQTGKDPIVTAASMITALQTIVSRNISPFDPTIVTIGSIHGGKVNNIIPSEVVFKGTIRTFSSVARHMAKNKFINIIEGLAATFEQQVEVNWDKGPSSVNNNPMITQIVKTAARKIMKVVPAELMGADDDFATYEERIPGCYAFIGSQGFSNLHHDDVIVNPQALKYAVKLHVEAAFQILKNLKETII